MIHFELRRPGRQPGQLRREIERLERALIDDAAVATSNPEERTRQRLRQALILQELRAKRAQLTARGAPDGDALVAPTDTLGNESDGSVDEQSASRPSALGPTTEATYDRRPDASRRSPWRGGRSRWLYVALTLALVAAGGLIAVDRSLGSSASTALPQPQNVATAPASPRPQPTPGAPASSTRAAALAEPPPAPTVARTPDRIDPPFLFLQVVEEAAADPRDDQVDAEQIADDLGVSGADDDGLADDLPLPPQEPVEDTALEAMIQPPAGFTSVTLRADPTTAAPVLDTLLPDARVTLLPGSSTANGFLWAHIRTSSGVEGWVVSTTLR